jgi:hypothetical protein
MGSKSYPQHKKPAEDPYIIETSQNKTDPNWDQLCQVRIENVYSFFFFAFGEKFIWLKPDSLFPF